MPKLRALPVVSALTLVGLAQSGRRLRIRAGRLAGLGPAEGSVDVSGWRVLAATGVEPRPETVAAAVAWAETEGLDAVDLVPADLPVERVLDLLRQVDPATFRAAATAKGRSAGHAIVVREEVAVRADLPQGPVSPAELAEVAPQVKRFAPRTFDLAVAPSERAVAWSADEELAFQRVVLDRFGSLALFTAGAQLALLGAGVAASRPLGLAAVAAFQAQPAVALGGHANGLAPADLGPRTATRWASEVVRLSALLRADAPEARSLRLAEEARPYYDAELPLGTDRFFEEPVEKCRWCGSTELRLLHTTPDLIQNKPGTFRLDECVSCGHVFQNPRLTPAGLDFYYRDCYDGFGEEEMEGMFATQSDDYESRAAMVRAVEPAPRRWLDVGSGHAHFCLVAREQFPETSFEGLDLGSAIDDAARRGWIDRSYRGMFPDVAPELADQFDVVSMHHYLEHTREPVEELDAAATALRPGGLLLIEVPDPEYPLGRKLGRYWMPWLQPQHQQFISMGRLEQALTERGFTVLDRQHVQKNPALNVISAGFLLAGHLVPRQGMPWRPRPAVTERAGRIAALTTLLPLAAVAGVVAQAVEQKGDDEPGAAYRVLARLEA
ncbi:class I SAM-dependent methyltransferase [Nocardioides sp. Y6]|uniref:Class I SAM-dependent methyltransferase n=1 Tax=Nocardioides malaquae TaxID=2773426 RepID=A0ABR9RV12_9ACTN|nr:class I SAM-dependent methyltransferase [Nocardioides malaquae]MBE7325444.1 class I SAM-dependent methyltransferase [Nocardioides malaquae]